MSAPANDFKVCGLCGDVYIIKSRRDYICPGCQNDLMNQVDTIINPQRWGFTYWALANEVA